MKRACYALGTALCLLLALIVIACAAVTRLGRDGALYARCFHAYADTAAQLVPEDQYDRLAQALGDYFSGRAESPQVFVENYDVRRPAYNERELAHLADIRALFRLFDKAWLLLIPLLALAVPLAERPDAKGFFLGCALAVLLLLAAAGYAALDFLNAFIALHRLLFTNELWLMNPRTDLLICLMPQAMFAYLARRLALTVIPAWLLLPTLAVLARLVCKNRKTTAGPRNGPRS